MEWVCRTGNKSKHLVAYKSVWLINMISVIDNGTEIAYEGLGDKFKPFNDSKKADKI